VHTRADETVIFSALTVIAALLVATFQVYSKLGFRAERKSTGLTPDMPSAVLAIAY
jgi:hypothetical protein